MDHHPHILRVLQRNAAARIRPDIRPHRAERGYHAVVHRLAIREETLINRFHPPLARPWGFSTPRKTGACRVGR